MLNIFQIEWVKWRILREISELEAAIHILEDKMATPEGMADVGLVEKYSGFSKRLETVMENWTKWSEELETLQTDGKQ